MVRRLLKIAAAALVIAAALFVCRRLWDPLRHNGVGRFDLIANTKISRLMEAEIPEYVDVQLIDVNGEARRGVRLEDFNGIVVHYVGNPGTTAQANHDYFDSPDADVSAHFVIGLEGEVIQCVPLYEKASASNERNRDTISIECCHPTESGEFTEATYDALVRLTAWLCALGDLEEQAVIRHYDVTGKECPLYFVEHEDEWNRFRADVAAAMSSE